MNISMKNNDEINLYQLIKLKTDFPCNLILWLMYFPAIFFTFIQKFAKKNGESHFDLMWPITTICTIVSVSAST